MRRGDVAGNIASDLGHEDVVPQTENGFLDVAPVGLVQPRET